MNELAFAKLIAIKQYLLWACADFYRVNDAYNLVGDIATKLLCTQELHGSAAFIDACYDLAGAKYKTTPRELWG